MLRTDFNGSPFVGVFGVVTDSSLLITPELKKVDKVVRELEVDNVYRGMLGECSVLGSMAVANSSGIAVSSTVLNSEIRKLKEVTEIPVERVPGNINAIGNVVLENDHAAVVNPGLSDSAKRIIGDVLDVEVHESRIAGLDVVGSAGVATNKGVLVHPKASDSEIEHLEDILGVPVDIGTVNYGTPLVGSGLLANSDGYVAGSETTGPELGRIEESLGFID